MEDRIKQLERKINKIIKGKTKIGKFYLSKELYTRTQKGNKTKYIYPFKSTEEAEEYFLGKNPRKRRFN